MKLIFEAAALAVKAHQGQIRKYILGLHTFVIVSV